MNLQREREVLGNRLLAFCLGLTATAQLNDPLDEQATRRHEILVELLDYMCEHEGNQTIQAWMMGSGCGGDAPAMVLRELPQSARQRVMGAASSLVTCGFS
jgi:hypothetical protein